ncbi:MAG TPA: methyltransferase domain-containing protein [Actinobacteria bacterium]|nr:methyltransferase domain-containing protein [Actinomycetota bacterium]
MKIHWWMRKWRYGKALKRVKEGAVVMDVGCGNEHLFLDMIQDRVRKGYGIDKKVEPYVEQKIEMMNFDFDNKSVVRFPLPEGSGVNQVFMLAVIEHVYHARAILEGIYNALEEGGEFFLTTPTLFSKPVLEFLSYRLKLVCEDQIRDHKHYFAKDEMEGLLGEIGFRDIRHKYFQCGMNQMIEARKPYTDGRMIA